MARNFESRVRERGRRLYRLMADEKPVVFQKKSWMGQVLDACMADDDFKVALFRFIDVLPALDSPKTVAEYLRQYFGRPGLKVPKFIGS